MHRSAVLAFPDADGRPQARLVLERILPGACIPEANGKTAGWLMCNPSVADHMGDDPTAGRVVHHSSRAGCARSLIGNVWPLRTPYPADLWPWVKTRGHVGGPARAATSPTARFEAMINANLDALAMIGAQADIHIVAFGTAPMDRHPIAVAQALEEFSLCHTVPLYCLGTTPAGYPLHPLARGKFAVRNDTVLQLWRPATPVKPWSEVFSDKQRTANGWRDV